jgi:hypothetical protein
MPANKSNQKVNKPKIMSTKYKTTTTEEAYFITMTTVGWIHVFTRLNQKFVLINALQHCQQNKGLEIYGYFTMSGPIHLLCKDRLKIFFEKVKCITVEHQTPFDTIQNFIFCSFKKLTTT